MSLSSSTSLPSRPRAIWSWRSTWTWMSLAPARSAPSSARRRVSASAKAAAASRPVQSWMPVGRWTRKALVALQGQQADAQRAQHGAGGIGHAADHRADGVGDAGMLGDQQPGVQALRQGGEIGGDRRSDRRQRQAQPQADIQQAARLPVFAQRLVQEQLAPDF